MSEMSWPAMLTDSELETLQYALKAVTTDFRNMAATSRFATTAEITRGHALKFEKLARKLNTPEARIRCK